MKRWNEEEIRQKSEAYFAACDSTREQVVLKNGGVSYYQIPYTVAGLAAALGVDRQTLEGYCRPGSKKGGLSAAARQTLRTALARVEQHTLERALLGELSGPMATMLLKYWGYRETVSPEDGHGISIVLEDKEGFGK